ncbi:uncharacterized protein JCM6883_003261 [Sporobolomyces salmoneus]|uniref:uncharacterized protein n=1 Tax=Sporobolomyces salmoneus TaxID=183962 RepID=UPI003181410A
MMLTLPISLLSLTSLALARPTVTLDSASTLVERNNDNPSYSGPTVEIRNGTVEGIRIESFNQDAFLGIPFAQPPVGNLRLRKPKSLETKFENGLFKADSYSPFCPGFGGDEIGYELAEDCLSVNVVRPAGVAENASLPIGLWIYGGGYQMGGNADRRYNGTWVVQRSVEMEKPIIFVSINYRVAAFGFLNSPALEKEGNQNIGLFDQRLALHWVQENIAAFGGDPSKVTIWGESAGAFSVAAHLLGYGLNETSLFRGAILESGANPLYYTVNSSSTWTPYNQSVAYSKILENAGCKKDDGDDSAQIDCLRSLDLETFNQSVSGPLAFWKPIVDGSILPELSSQQFERGNFVKVPLLLGTNTDEGTGFGLRGINTTDELVDSLVLNFDALSRNSTENLVSLYSEDPSEGCPYNTGDGVLPTGVQDKRSLAIHGDIQMTAPRRYLAEAAARYSPVYSYRFDVVPQDATILTGVTHFQEVAYVFSNPLPTQNPLGTRPGDAEVANLITSQFISFIHDLTPNNNGVAGSVEWPNYQESPQNFVFRRNGSWIEPDTYRAEGIAYINEIATEFQR